MSAANRATLSFARLSLLKDRRPIVEQLERRLLYCVDGTHHHDSMEAAAESGLDSGAAPAGVMSGAPVARSSTRERAPATPSRRPGGSASRRAVPRSPSQLTSYNVRFAIIGDFGCNCTGERDVANMVKSWGVDFVLTTGDNSYPDASAAYLDKNVGQYYHQFIYPYRGSYGAGSPTGANRFFPIMGNHEWDGGSSSNYLNYFTLPGKERYYEMRAGPVHIFALDSDSREPDGRSSTSVQAQWLRDRMSASTAAWQIPLVHEPPYSSGGGTSTTMRWPYKTWGADALVAGHAHVYERIETGGMTYFVNGLGGAARHTFTTPVAGSQVRYAADVGAMLVEANSQAITFKFISRSGSVIDTRTLTAPPPAQMTPVIVTPSGGGSGGGWQPVGSSPMPREAGAGPFDDVGDDVGVVPATPATPAMRPTVAPAAAERQGSRPDALRKVPRRSRPPLRSPPVARPKLDAALAMKSALRPLHAFPAAF